MTRLTAEQTSLVVEHIELANHAARWAHFRWPATDRDDLLSWANEGLMSAAQSWDPDGGMTFVGWARTQIRRRMTDSWRLSTRRGRTAGKSFPFDHTALDEQRVDIIRAAASVELGYERIEERSQAASTVAGLALSERERYIVVELGSGVSLQEIGDALGVSESRVCQIRKEIYDRLVGDAPGPALCEWCRCPIVVSGTRRRFCSHAHQKRAWRAAHGREVAA